MKSEFSDDTLLARWLSGELSETEEQELRQHPDFKLYERIASTATSTAIPNYNEEKQLDVLHQYKQSVSRRKRIALIPAWSYALAAAIALFLLAGYFLFPTSKQHQVNTQIGEKKEFLLPDGSKIMLNAVSQISYDEVDWMSNRSISLDGEAYFEVEKGNTFSVLTPLGTVNVLGTKFNIRSRADHFTVSCFEGKVEVQAVGQQLYLTANETALLRKTQQLEKSTDVLVPTPDWLKGKTRYNAPLNEVLAELEQYYAIQVINKSNQNPVINGGFPHDDLAFALKSIIGPINGLNYTIENNGSIIQIFNE